MARGGSGSLFYESRPRPLLRMAEVSCFEMAAFFCGRCLDAARGRDIFVRYILRGVNPGPSVRRVGWRRQRGRLSFRIPSVKKTTERSNWTMRRKQAERRQRNSVTSVGEGREFLRNYLETHALPTTLSLAISLPLSFYLVSVLE